MRKKKQSKFPAKYVLLIMTILCAVIIGCSLKTSGSGPVSAAAGAVLAPMQKGVNQLGSLRTFDTCKHEECARCEKHTVNSTESPSYFYYRGGMEFAGYSLNIE